MAAPNDSLFFALNHGLREAVLIGVGCALVAAGSNALRRDRIPFVQRDEYPLFVPCPESHGSAEGLAALDPRLQEEGVLFVDARSAKDYATWHAAGAVSLVYDFLEPVAENAVRSLLRSRATRVAIYGDGSEPDSGQELAKELSGKGVRHVVFVRGGAKALAGGSLP
jgi:rhodanese-related sulfurtransferase